MRSVDQDLLLSDDSEREIISNANDVSGEKVNGNQVGCERNDQGRSREERQGDGIGRLERLARLERYERLGEVERPEPLGEVERESLKSWLAQFSAHIHLPRAYQVCLRPSLKYCPRRTLAFAFNCLQNDSAGEPVQS